MRFTKQCGEGLGRQPIMLLFHVYGLSWKVFGRPLIFQAPPKKSVEKNKKNKGVYGDLIIIYPKPYELLSKLLVSPLITPIVVPYILPYISPV